MAIKGQLQKGDRQPRTEATIFKSQASQRAQGSSAKVKNIERNFKPHVSNFKMSQSRFECFKRPKRKKKHLDASKKIAKIGFIASSDNYFPGKFSDSLCFRNTEKIAVFLSPAGGYVSQT